MNIAGKVAVVSGAARGLGLGFAKRLADAGCKVLGFDLLEEVTAAPGITAMVADVGCREDVGRIVGRATSMGEVGVLVNNAGVWRRTPVTDPFDKAVTDWDFIMNTNLKGVMMLSRSLVPHMKPGGGHIINISSYYVLPAKSDGTNPPDTDLYNASRWALNGFTDAWAKYLAPDNIKVNGLCMGAVDTPMSRGLFPNHELPPEMAAAVMQPEDLAEQMMEVIASGRTGENFGAWVGEEVRIGDMPAPHRRITG